VIKRLRLPAKIHAIEGREHSSKASKSLGVPQQEVHEAIMDEVSQWIRSRQLVFFARLFNAPFIGANRM
jgi:hypothetical protein